MLSYDLESINAKKLPILFIWISSDTYTDVAKTDKTFETGGRGWGPAKKFSIGHQETLVFQLPNDTYIMCV